MWYLINPFCHRNLDFIQTCIKNKCQEFLGKLSIKHAFSKCFLMVKNPNSDRELVGATEFVATDPLLKKHQMLDPVTAMEREQELRSNHDFLNS